MKLQILLLIFICFSTLHILAQTDEADLAKATQNPVADLISVPFQNNTTYGNGPFNRPQNVLNIQPVLPIGIGENITMINRVIAPIITQPSTTEDKSTTGLGDINYSAFFSPKGTGKIIYGVGPVLQFPTATKKELGSKEFGVGPSVVALTMVKKWVMGIVVNNVWTFGDIGENKFLLQYFVNYNLPKAWYITSAPIMTANWNAADGQQWVIPFGGGIGKVFKIGKQPMNLNVQGYYNAVTPTGMGEWQSRIQLQFLFPKKPKE
jgi:hypothetical protein